MPTEDGVTVTIDGWAVGGEGVGRLPDGRTVFVAGALPGETVELALTTEKERWARAVLLAVRRPSPVRCEPVCAWQRAGCGGCDLMMVTVAAQREARVELGRQSLERLGRLSEPEVVHGPDLPSEAVRTTVRVAVSEGRAAYRRRASHDLVAVDSCLVVHPGLQELLAQGRFGTASEATLRIGAATGERLVIAAPTARGVQVPDGVVVVGEGELPRNGAHRAHLHEVVDDHRWRVSAGSFFQTSAVGAQALVDAVREALGPEGADAARALDAYCGVGLLSAAFGPGTEVLAIESAGSSVADAEVNLAGLVGAGRLGAASVVRGRVERWSPPPCDAAVADPARRGLGAPGVATVVATGAPVVVLVSCDLASLGRDSADLVEAGYRHVRSTVLDLFPHTSHAEVVTRFER